MAKDTEQLHLQDLADTTVINPVDANKPQGLDGLGGFPPVNGDGFVGFAPEGDDNEGSIAVKAKKSHKALIAVLIAVAVVLAALVAVFFTMRWHYSDRVAPGVSFGTVKVAGQTRADLTATVNKAVKDSSIVVKGDNDRQVSASLKDLGVSVDVDKTVNDLMNAKKSDNLLQDIVRLNPLSHANVKLAAQVNTYEMSSFLSSKLISDDERAVASSISYDPNAQGFVVTEGRDGDTPDIQPVDAAVEQAIKKPGTSATVEITNKQVDMPITTDEAQKTADEANQRLTNKIVLTNGDAKQFEIPVDEVAKWIKPNGDPSKGQITIEYDAEAIKTYLAATLPQQLNQEAVSQEDVVDDKGKVILEAATKGVNGVTVKNTDNTADQVLAALKTGNGATLQVETDVKKFDIKQKKSEWRIVVDRSNQTATVYQNDQAVKTFPVCTGTNKHVTDLGTYTIYLRYAIQDMTGLNDDGSRYLSKGVKWVSYFNGGEGFHTASWNNYGIAHGDPVNYGSHGCVNMYEADSKWIYDHCPQGTIVQVIGSQPSGAVR
ncbi:ErfK/YbiS/YcfS/YnhG superfamily protein [Bifidobacterium sp. DSM 109960]|uniref:ErfK/YbiS/YcfS/YnhG superfamily protein n=1 Tax=Bifidobacterium erythrocebi TaxID=2675325 RepID=A0A7Y0HUY0_9BIFI|nr:L,D-transpeptidase [Bifidobacterium sp. DSM 109960]NMM96661.1 ErfK/YbiS/YcfS/YnhG superfamily protein [Bifidobacterium sp. DSM 109960]